MRVENIKSRNGNAVPNQFIIHAENAEYFQSYKVIIAKRDYLTCEYTLDVNYWDYSVTTGKYRNIFLGENKSETEKKIKSGEYTLTDLN